MPPTIALILCILFILCIFRIDFKRKTNVSIALWIPLIWMMIIGSRMVSQWLDLGGRMSGEAYLEGSPLDRIVFSLLILAGLFILSKRKIYWSQIIKQNLWIFIFFLYCGISITWSEFPGVSFKRFIKASGNIIMVLVILTEPDPVEAVKTMTRRCAYILIPMSICLLKYFPYLGREYHRYSGELAITGVTTNKNSLGALCLVCGLFFAWNMLSKWKKKSVSIEKKEVIVQIFIFVMILWLLIKSNSATSLICFIAGIFVILLLGYHFIKKNIQYIGWCILFISFCFIPFLLYNFDAFINYTGHSDTFWGRTVLWEVIKAMKENTLVGTGYGSFFLGERLDKLWEIYWWKPSEAHNGYLEIYLELGLFGLFLLIGVIILSFRNIKSGLAANFEYGRFRMSILFITLIYNIMESAFQGLHLMWFYFLLVSIEVSLPVTASELNKD